ncbi:Lrp/AsnC family transcriptional regulator [Rhizobium mongolense]|uniref:Lrp/AsnC family leucine-responsive transcriptional regulator n=1 Tax=Rhizobium mongolense TaxID=57676 RepID=A0A7W6RS47_9HYPH|nr:Lrp/AsnC family transcriptional regulator [Rhizobium mongolense]MBB4277616.1 Lrp/AsnC family leucine-responsive transcriptional regulator [Rhizobium mongolense]
MDRIDEEIIHLLEKNSKLTQQEISEEVGISLSACQRRIKTLEQTGVISGYKAVIDPAYLGEGLVVFVLVSLERHSKDGVRAFEAAVSRLSMIKEIYHVAGEYDFIIKVAVADIKDYQNFNYDELANIPGMGKTSSLIALADRKAHPGRRR